MAHAPHGFNDFCEILHVMLEGDLLSPQADK
jgi:hypothetical protein